MDYEDTKSGLDVTSFNLKKTPLRILEMINATVIFGNNNKYNIQLKDDKTYPWICIKKGL